MFYQRIRAQYYLEETLAWRHSVCDVENAVVASQHYHQSHGYELGCADVEESGMKYE